MMSCSRVGINKITRSNNTFSRVLLAVAIFANVLCFPALVQALIIEGITIIDGTGRQPVSDASVLIQGERINRVIRGHFEEEIKKGHVLVDGAGKYMMPGLMDVHVHLIGGTKISKEGLRETTLDFVSGIEALHGYLYSGVTTIYDVGNNPDFIFSLRQRERSGEIAAPRIFATGGIVTYPGSHGASSAATLVDRWPEAIPDIDKHIAREPDMVKFTLEERGWGMRPLIPLLPLDLLEKMVEYYNDHGVRSTVHTAGERRARQAIFAGVDTLAHPVITGPVSDKFVRLMAARKTPMASTLTIGENYSRLAEAPEFLDQPLYQATLNRTTIKQMQGETRDKYNAAGWTWWMKIMTPVAQENLMKINKAGGIVALGTDSTYGPSVHREMELLVNAGISPLDVIRIGTFNAARYLGREEEMGTVSEGKLADLLLLNENPVENINNAKNIFMVIKNGVIIDRSELKIPINE